MTRTLGISVVGALMIAFGVAEVATAFTHEFFGLSTERGTASTAGVAGIGLLYIAAGLLSLTMRRWALTAALVCLALDVAGRIGAVVAGVYPLLSSWQVAGIVVGTLIAVVFAAYLASQRARFA
jgi:hypothetical protein